MWQILLDREVFAERLRINLAEKNRLFTKMYDAEPIEFDDIFEEYYEYGQQMKTIRLRYICHFKRCIRPRETCIIRRGTRGYVGYRPRYLSIRNIFKPSCWWVTIGSGVGPSKLIKSLGYVKRTLLV